METAGKINFKNIYLKYSHFNLKPIRYILITHLVAFMLMSCTKID